MKKTFPKNINKIVKIFLHNKKTCYSFAATILLTTLLTKHIFKHTTLIINLLQYDKAH